MYTHLSSLAPPLALRPESSTSSYYSKSGKQAGECNSLLIYWRLGLLCPIMHPPAIRRQPEQQLREETAVKNMTLDPRVYRPPYCVLSLLMEERRQQEAWLKVWEEQAGKQELLAAVFPRPFMWSAEKSPVNMDDGCFCVTEWLRLSFRIYYRCCFHGQHQKGFYEISQFLFFSELWTGSVNLWLQHQSWHTYLCKNIEMAFFDPWWSPNFL